MGLTFGAGRLDPRLKFWFPAKIAQAAKETLTGFKATAQTTARAAA
ncbi:MAG TPA: hypothetical protein VES73_00685 [Lamprocystis sp. (in: g-proteobacteria)]|nr:hypothetical protein [Lamprocystis sp. (in: g-proteobacteria)]